MTDQAIGLGFSLRYLGIFVAVVDWIVSGEKEHFVATVMLNEMMSPMVGHWTKPKIDQ